MSVSAIFLTNLPWGITAEDLRQQLEVYPEVFRTAYDDTPLNVQIFTNSRNVSTAVVEGLDCDFERMMLDARGLELSNFGTYHRVVGIKPDTGDERLPNGSFASSRACGTKRDFVERVGLGYRKMTELFDPKFWTQVNTFIYLSDNRMENATQEGMVVVNTTNVNESMFGLPGGLNYVLSPQHFHTTTKVMYHSALELIQAVAKLNWNPVLLQEDGASFLPQFQSQDGRLRATYNKQTGLGLQGGCLEIEQMSRCFGFIPFDQINPSLLNLPFIQGLESYCWRCEGTYKLIGVTLQLASLAGRCGCDYSEEEKPFPYHWVNEKFTRLVGGKKEKGKTKDLFINHYPVKQMYQDAQEYRCIMMPLLEEEWYFSSTKFGKENGINGTILDSRKIEELVDKKGNKKNLYAFQIIVNLGGVWTSENKHCITQATLKWEVPGQKENEVMKYEAKTKVCNMRTRVDGSLLVIVRAKLLPAYPLLKKDDKISLVPKPNKTEYASMRKELNHWVDNPVNSSPLLQLLLDPGRPPNNDGWKMVVDASQLLVLHPMDKTLLSAFLQSLNTQQREAVKRAERHMASVIQGPPGTGKTHTVSATTLYLSMKEKGAILICAPSNYAANGVVISLNKMMLDTGITRKVIRIFSPTRALQLLQGAKIGAEESLFLSLHEEVRKSPRWLNDEEVKDMEIIAERVNNHTQFLLTEEQTMSFRRHEAEIEYEVLKKFDVFVCTVGCLSDNRLASLADKKGLATVILDESGQLSQPATIHLLSLRSRRVVFAGDQLQLPATIKSFAAQSAGLNLSLMDMLPGYDQSGRNNIYPCFPPWTTLLMQHRMHPDIRTIVSNLTYNGRLMDSLSVSSKGLAPHFLPLERKMIGKRVGILDHKALETSAGVGKGFYNLHEVEVVTRFAKLLAMKGVPAKDITVLTFYENQRKQLELALPPGIEAKNVDAFQGRENSVVIVSFVRSNNTTKTDVGFLTNLNRINVALSRAQDYLFIAWNSDFFKKSKLQHFMKLCKLLETSAHVFNF